GSFRRRNWRTVAWMVDDHYKPRAVLRAHEDRKIIAILDPENGDYQERWELKEGAEDMVYPLGIGSGKLYMAAPENGRLALKAFDLGSPDTDGELIFSDPRYDVGTTPIRIDGVFVGVRHPMARRDYYVDPDLQKLQARVDRQLPGAYNQLISFSADFNRYLLLSSSSSEPALLLVGDR